MNIYGFKYLDDNKLSLMPLMIPLPFCLLAVLDPSFIVHT